MTPRRIPGKKKKCVDIRERRDKGTVEDMERKRGERNSPPRGNHRTPGSEPVCVKRFQAAGVFGRGEMKILPRYLSPEKYQPRPHFAGHKSINEEKTRPLPKICGVRAVIGYSISIHHTYIHTRNLSRRRIKGHNDDALHDSIAVNLNTQHFNLIQSQRFYIFVFFYLGNTQIYSVAGIVVVK